MNRRQLLRSAAALGLGGGLSWRLWAAPSAGSGARLLVVFLRGAYDSLSALVPYAEPFYHEARPTLALPSPAQGREGGVVALDGRWGLAPALEDSLLPMFEAGQLAFVPFAGTEFVSRSHFQAQDWIEFGQAPGVGMAAGSGFLNRLVAQLKTTGAGRGMEAVSFTPALPSILQGGVPVPNSPVRLPKRRPLGLEYEQGIQAMYAGHALEAMVRDGLGLRREIASQIREEMQAASRAALPAASFALEAHRIGRMLRERPEYSVGFVDVGGWDTHASQGGAQGQLAVRLRGLGDGLESLAEALGPDWQRTVVVVMSEFGRTFRENGSRGTDHGHGTAMWVAGGAVQGGAIRGEQTGMRAQDLHQGRDLPVLNEYRSLLAGLMTRMFGLSRPQVEAVFPGAVASDLGLL